MCLEKSQLPKSFVFQGRPDGISVSVAREDLPGVYDLTSPGVPGSSFAQESESGREFVEGGENRKVAETVIHGHRSKRTKYWETDVCAMGEPLLLEDLCFSSPCSGILTDPEINGVMNMAQSNCQNPDPSHVDYSSLFLEHSALEWDSHPKCEEFCCDMTLPVFDSCDMECKNFESLGMEEASLLCRNYASLFPSEDDDSLLCVEQFLDGLPTSASRHPEASKWDTPQLLQFTSASADEPAQLNESFVAPEKVSVFYVDSSSPRQDLTPLKDARIENYQEGELEVNEIQERSPCATTNQNLCVIAQNESAHCSIPLVYESEVPRTLESEMDLENELWHCESYVSPYLRAESAESSIHETLGESPNPFPFKLDDYLNGASPSHRDDRDDCESCCSNHIEECDELLTNCMDDVILQEPIAQWLHLLNEPDEKDESEGVHTGHPNKPNWNTTCQTMRQADSLNDDPFCCSIPSSVVYNSLYVNIHP